MKLQRLEGLTPEEKEQKIKELQARKVELLNQYGLFGGGKYAADLFRSINIQLEQLGVDPEW